MSLWKYRGILIHMNLHLTKNGETNLKPLNTLYYCSNLFCDWKYDSLITNVFECFYDLSSIQFYFILQKKVILQNNIILQFNFHIWSIYIFDIVFGVFDIEWLFLNFYEMEWLKVMVFWCGTIIAWIKIVRVFWLLIDNHTIWLPKWN